MVDIANCALFIRAAGLFSASSAQAGRVLTHWTQVGSIIRFRDRREVARNSVPLWPGCNTACMESNDGVRFQSTSAVQRQESMEFWPRMTPEGYKWSDAAL